MAINVTKMPLNRPNRSPSSKKYINEPKEKEEEEGEEQQQCYFARNRPRD